MLESLLIKSPLSLERTFKQETQAQVVSYDYCEIFKNTHFGENQQRAASGYHSICSPKDTKIVLVNSFAICFVHHFFICENNVLL